MQYIFYVLIFIVGAIFGSFLCCQARRLHERELKGKKLPPRSICMSCKYQLKWYDNIPILSWLLLKGRCRKCKKKIGAAEIIAEGSCALAALLVSINFNPEAMDITSWLVYGTTLMLTLSLCFLGIYDGLYGELPTFALILSAVIAVASFAIIIVSFIVSNTFTWPTVYNPLISAIFFGGIYLALYLVSKGKWVGDGDWILAGIIGLALGDIWLSAIALFVANLSASLIMLPSVAKKKSSKIYFGPFLVLSYVLVLCFEPFLSSIVI